MYKVGKRTKRRNLKCMRKGLCLKRFVFPRSINLEIENCNNVNILQILFHKDNSKLVTRVRVKFKLDEEAQLDILDKYFKRIILKPFIQTIQISSTINIYFGISIRLLSSIIQLKMLKSLVLKEIFIKGKIQILFNTLRDMKGRDYKMNKLIIKTNENRNNILKLTPKLMVIMTSLLLHTVGWTHYQQEEYSIHYINNLKLLLATNSLSSLYFEFADFKNKDNEFSEVITLLQNKISARKIKIENFNILEEEQQIIFVQTIEKLPNLAYIQDLTEYTNSEFSDILNTLNIRRMKDYKIKWEIESNGCNSAYYYPEITHIKIRNSKCSKKIPQCILESNSLQILEINNHKKCGFILNRDLISAVLNSPSFILLKLSSQYNSESELSFLLSKLIFHNNKIYIKETDLIKDVSITTDIYIKLCIIHDPNSGNISIDLFQTNAQLNFPLLLKYFPIRKLGVLKTLEISDIKRLLFEIHTFNSSLKELRLVLFPGWHNLKKILYIIRKINLGTVCLIIDCKSKVKGKYWPKKKTRNITRKQFFDWLRQYSFLRFTLIKILLSCHRLTSYELSISPFIAFISLYE